MNNTVIGWTLLLFHTVLKYLLHQVFSMSFGVRKTVPIMHLLLLFCLSVARQCISIDIS